MPYLVVAEGDHRSLQLEGLYETEAEATRFAQHLRRVQRLRLAAGDEDLSPELRPCECYSVKYVPLCAAAPDPVSLEQVEAVYADRARVHQERQRRAASERLAAQRRNECECVPSGMCHSHTLSGLL